MEQEEGWKRRWGGAGGGVGREYIVAKIRK